MENRTARAAPGSCRQELRRGATNAGRGIHIGASMTSLTMMKLSVVIPTFNRRQILERTLAALSAQDFPPDDYEIIVVVDGSTDGTAELLRDWKSKCAFRTFNAPHRGVSAARNMGIRAAVGELVLLLDDDLIAAPDLIRQHCAAHSTLEPCVVHGPIYIAPGSSPTLFGHIRECFFEDHYRHLSPALDLRFPNGIPSLLTVLTQLANASVPRDLLLRCGGFDQQIRAAEDLDLGLRLWKMSASFRYSPAATTHELYVKSSRDYLRGQARALGAGDLITARKHPEYRPHSRLAHFAETPVPKKWIRNALMRFPLSPVPLLALPLGLERWFCRWSSLRQAGLKLFSFAEPVAAWRGALSAAGSWTELKNEFDRRVPVLMYHHVGPRRHGVSSELSVSPEQFEQEMRWLARRGYVGISPSDWLRWLRDGKDLPAKPVLLTFDDAYADIAKYALPVLRRYGFKGAVFVVTGQLAGTNTWDEAKGHDTHQLMSEEQIRYWAGQEIEFGTHSRTHADLTQLSANECIQEIAGSKADLAALLGSSVVSFAYPYGKYNDAVRDVVGGEFDLAFSVNEGMNYLRSDPHLLRRTYVGPDDSLIDFGHIVRRGERVKSLRVKLALRTRLRRAAALIVGRKTGGKS